MVRSAAPHSIGMAGSSPAMTGEGVTKAGAGRWPVRDEGQYDQGQWHARPEWAKTLA
ncbi:hypothetical protein J4G37_25545 [Microvirga sp. 3-52]|nr:hypothetical protein [Microvirga sp. 3-52]